MKESLKNFYNYDASDEELLMYIRINAGSMIAERIKELKNLQSEFRDSLWDETSGP